MTPDFYKLWAQHFAPSVDTSSSVPISPDWAAFFIASMMNPGILPGPRSSWHQQHGPSFQSLLHVTSSFLYPQPHVLLSLNCDHSTSMAEDLINAAEVENEGQHSGSPSPLSDTDLNLDQVSPSSRPWSAALLAKTGKLKLTEDDPSLRRSLRHKVQKKGFKHRTCQDRHCIACEADPPTIPPSIIKNLCATFCDIELDKLTDVALMKRKKASAPVGKKKPVKKPNIG